MILFGYLEVKSNWKRFCDHGPCKLVGYYTIGTAIRV